LSFFDHLVDVNRRVGWSTEGCFHFDPRCGNEEKREDLSLPMVLGVRYSVFQGSRPEETPGGCVG